MFVIELMMYFSFFPDKDSNDVITASTPQHSSRAPPSSSSSRASTRLTNTSLSPRASNPWHSIGAPWSSTSPQASTWRPSCTPQRSTRLQNAWASSHTSPNVIENEVPYHLISNHPGIVVRLNKVRPKSVVPEERENVVQDVQTYLTKLSRISCYNRDAKYNTTCTCLNGLDDDSLTSLSESVVSFFMLPKDVLETILKERLKGAKDRRKIHDKNLNSHKYRAAVDDTAA